MPRRVSAPRKRPPILVLLGLGAAGVLIALAIFAPHKQLQSIFDSEAGNPQREAERFAIAVEQRVSSAATTCLQNGPRAQLAELAKVPASPERNRALRDLLDSTRNYCALAGNNFIVRAGKLEFPAVSKFPSRKLESYLLREEPALRARYNSLLGKARRTAILPAKQIRAAKLYSLAESLPVSPELRALAAWEMAQLYRSAGKPSKGSEAYRRLLEEYRDVYSLDGQPYAVLAALELRRLKASDPATLELIRDTAQQLAAGRWELSSETAQLLLPQFAKIGDETVQGSLAAFQQQFRMATALQQALLKRDRRFSQEVILAPGKEKTSQIDMFAFAFFEREQEEGSAYQSYYVDLNGAASRTLWGFTVDRGWLESELAALGLGDKFLITYRPQLGTTRFRKVFPMWELTLTPTPLRWTTAWLGFLVAAGLLAISILLATGLMFALRRLRDVQLMAQMRTDFVSGVSHELKTPTTLIRLFSETMVEDPNTPEKSREHCMVITAESERLTYLIDQVLDFSRIDRGVKRYNLQPGDLGREIESVLRVYQIYLDQKNFTLSTNIQRDLPVVKFDPEAIRSLVLNLVENAVKYSRESRLVWVRVYRENKGVIIEVEDQGIGIPASERAKIFKPFYRVNTASSQGGSGLGLFLVDHIVQGHAGNVKIASDVGMGTIFRVYLPATKQPLERGSLMHAFDTENSS